ncbi:hypothetical protein ACTGZQ_11110 [Streptococcus suis]
MKKLILIISVSAITMVLSSCRKPTTEGQSEILQYATKNIEVSEEKVLELVTGTHNSTQIEAIEHAEKILNDNPDLGKAGMLNLNYLDSTIDDGETVYGVFLISNKTQEVLDKAFEFSISWSYDGTIIYDNSKILYEPLKYGVLTPYSASIIFLPLPSDKVEFIGEMVDSSKMVLSLSDFAILE